jgi:hypothetical protein
MRVFLATSYMGAAAQHPAEATRDAAAARPLIARLRGAPGVHSVLDWTDPAFEEEASFDALRDRVTWNDVFILWLTAPGATPGASGLAIMLTGHAVITGQRVLVVQPAGSGPPPDFLDNALGHAPNLHRMTSIEQAVNAVLQETAPAHAAGVTHALEPVAEEDSDDSDSEWTPGA